MSSVVHPSSLDEAQDCLRQAATDRTCILPVGNRSRLARCFPDAQADTFMSFAKMNQILAVDAEDLVCRVQPGLSAEELAQEIAPRGLELGVCSPGAATGTLGGLFLAPEVSLLSHRWGPPRDQVLGARWLLADGSLVMTGSSVVKSVAGYDVTRLFLGSRGRLAACVELILRLRPLPRRSAWWSQPWAEADPIAGPGVDLRFSVPEEELLWSRGDSLSTGSAPGLQTGVADKGEEALAQCLQLFADRPFRLTQTTMEGRNPQEGALDWLAWQQALDRLPTPLPEGVCTHPPPTSSSWLVPLQRACAPDAIPFGGPTPV